MFSVFINNVALVFQSFNILIVVKLILLAKICLRQRGSVIIFSLLCQCLQNEFGCSNGECIPLELRCDGAGDCEDNLDEKNCTMVITNDELYRKDYPPLENNRGYVLINSSITILSFGQINEIEEAYNAKFHLRLMW